MELRLSCEIYYDNSHIRSLFCTSVYICKYILKTKQKYFKNVLK